MTDGDSQPPRLAYRDFRDDLPYVRTSRWWPMARCFFYAMLFGSLATFISVSIFYEIRNGSSKWPILLILILLAIFGSMFYWSVSSLVRIARGRTRDPFA